MIETARHSQQVPQRDLAQLQLRIGGNILGERVDQSRIERQQAIFNRNANSRRNITFSYGNKYCDPGRERNDVPR